MSANEPKPASPRVRRPPPVVPVRREGPPPLSFAQRRMWFLSRLDPSGFAYNAPFFARLKGRLDVSTLERALTEVVRRHEALRTTFAEVEGEPVQCIAPEAPVSLVVERLEGPEREQEARRLAEEEARRPFDLGMGPMLRARLLRLDEEEHVLLLTLHHISCDGWSLSLLERDVGELYGAFLEGRESKLSALTVQYADHAVWQREWLKGEVLEEQLAWWKQHLEGASPALELPTDRPRPPVQSAKGAVLGVPLPAELMKALRERCKQEAVTPFMLLLASLQALLSRHSGQPDVVVGTPIAGRTRREVEGLIGFFANTLALRVDVDGNESFKSLLGRVRQACLGAYQHQDVPFERLVDALRPVRDLSRSPLFQVLLVLQNAPPLVRLSGLESRDVDFEPGVAKFDLTLFVRETPEGWVALWEYSTALFDEATVRRFAGHYVALLKGVLEDPERKVGQVDLLDEEERRRVLPEWPRWEELKHPSWLMHRRVEAQAARTPSAVAVTNGGGSLTYAQLEQRANQLAHHLMALGIRPGSVVGLCLERSSLDLPVAVLATLKAGAACMPLDPGYPPSRLAQMLDDVGAPVVLVHGALEHALPGEGTARRVRLEEEAARIAEQSTVAPGWVLSPELPCYVLFTSGSTGQPKGVTMSHRAFGTLVSWQLASTSAPGARTLQFASLSFDVSFQELFCTLCEGGTLVLVSAATRQDPATLMASLREHRVERLFVPFVALQALSERARHEVELPPLREVVTAGEPLQVTPAVVSFFERLPGCVLENQYGPTETHVVTAWRAKGPPSTWPALPPVGRPIVPARVWVLDAWGAPCPIGVTGEVCVGERSLAHGYWGRPELTAERFVPNVLDGDRDGPRIYRTGDRGRWLADGNLELQGRADEQVKVRGFRVELGEVEVALKELPGVTDAAVVVRRTDGGEKRLVAYVVRPESGDAEDLKRRQANQQPESWDAEDLKRRLAKRLPEYMVPGVLVRLESLPLTPSGKVNRRALPEVDSRRAEEGARYEAPRDVLERTLAEVWQEVLGVSLVGVRDDFFALGGHSLLATRVVSRLRDALGHDVPVRLLFESPTVEALAERLGTLGGHARLPVLTRAERLVDPPLSFAQRRLWFLAQLDAGGHSYNLPFVVRLHGALKVEALERALAEVVRRHEALRTSFVEVEGEPVQRVAADAVVPLTVESVEGADDVEEAVRSRVVREVQAPFDVARAPLLRATLLRTRGDEQVLVVVLHHLVADGWSLGVLTRELESLYGAAVKGETASLPELPVQYADYSVWQHGWLTGDVEASQLSWWKEALKGAPPVLELPTDRPRPAVQGYRGASVPVRLSSELSEALRRLSRREGATLYMTLLAGFQVLLARYSGQWDVVVGSPVSGRTARETEGLMGFFVNTLALRAQPDSASSFQAFLRQTKETVLGALAHQDVPFERLVEHLRPERDLSRSPLFQVLFTLQEAAPLLTLPGVPASPWDFASTIAKFDLELLLVDAPGAGVEGQLIYNADLFEPSTVQRISECFLELLRNLSSRPEARLSALPLLPPDERQRVLEAWNQTAVEFPREGCVHHLFEEQVALRPDAVALEFGEQRLSYRELEARANQLAWALKARGVGVDVLVAVCLERSVELIVSLLAILKAGGAYVPLDSSYPARRLEQMLEDTTPRLLITTRALLEQLPQEGRPELMLLEEERLAGLPTTAPRMPVSGRNLAYVDFTSGSTGRPKGVAVEHRGVLRLLYGAPYARLGPEETFLLIAPISFDASTLEVWGPLCLGGRLVVFPPRSPSELDLLTDVLHRHSVTLLHLTAGLFSQMVELGMDGLKGVRQLLTGGDVVSAPHVKRVLEELKIPVTACYGPTESTLFTSVHRMTRVEDVGASVPIGRPIGNTQVYVLDAGMEPVPVGVAGELYIGGDGLARGYLRQPDVTADRFIPNPFSAVPGERLYRTGDLARFRPDGVLEFLGRRDSQVKVRGYRIELAEVEAALLGHPAVKDGLVVVRDGAGGKRLVAYYVEHAQPLEAPRVRDWLKQKLPEFMVPSAFVKLAALPLTANGKVDRKALPSPEQDGPSAEAVQGPRTVMESLVARIWIPLLGVARVGVKDDFFALGGHSLLATRVVSRLRAALGRDVPVRWVFEAPTVEALAERLEAVKASAQGASTPVPVRVSRQAAMPLSFAQQRLWFLGKLDAGGYSYNLPFVVRLRGALNVKALEHSLSAMVRRHEALRTTFEEVEGEPVQRIASDVAVPLSVVEASEDAVRGQVETLARQSFDLGTGPLLRVTLLKLDEQEHVLVLVLHHIVADGWSMGVLTKELEALYTRGDAALPELPVQYADYAVWQREWLKGEVLEEQLSWWRARLAGAPEVLEVPTDRPRPAVQGYRGASVAVKLSTELSEKLKRLSRAEGVTLYMTLLAGFQVLLARYSGQWDVVVGSPVSGRTTKEVEGLIGFFVNTLVVRTEASAELTFREMLERVKESVLGAFGHQEVPFEKLVEALQSSRDLSRAPLVQIAFGLNGPAQLPALPGLSSSEVIYEPGMAKFDLALSVREDAEDLTGFWELNTDLFDAETVERLATHYQQLLEAAVENPEAKLSALPLSGHHEVPVKVPVARLQARRLDLLAPESVPEGFIAPRTAIEELVAGVWAPLLGVKHVGVDDNFFERGGHSLLVMQVASRLREVLGREVSVRMLFEAPTVATLARSLETLVGGGAGRGRPELVPTTRTEAPPQSFAQQRLWFLDRLEPNSPLYNIPLAMRLTGALDVAALERSFHTLVRRHESLRTTFEQGDQGAVQHIRPFEPAPLPVVDLSGLPVMAREREALRLGAEEGQRPFDLGTGPLLRVTLLKLDEQEHVLVLVLHHIVADGWSMGVLTKELEALYTRGDVALPELPVQYADYAVWQREWLKGEVLEEQLSWWRARLAGAPEVLEVPTDRPRPAVQGYRGASVAVKLSAELSEKLKRLSRAEGVTLYMTLLAGFQVLLARYSGQWDVVVGSPVSGRTTKEVEGLIGFFVNTLVVRTEASAELTFREMLRRVRDAVLGALTHQEVPFEKLVDALQLSRDLSRSPLVQVSFALQSAPSGDLSLPGLTQRPLDLGTRTAKFDLALSVREDAEGLSGYWELNSDLFDTATVERMATHYQRLLEAVVEVPEAKLRALPMPGHREVPVKVAGPRIQSRSGERVISEEGLEGFIAPRTAMEELVAETWAPLLGVKRLGAEDNFFERGGHSLLVMQAASRLRAALGHEVPVRMLFEAPTVSSLATRLSTLVRGGLGARSPELLPASRADAPPLSFAQQRLWFLDRLEPNSPLYNIALAMTLEGALDVGSLEKAFHELVRRHESLRTTVRQGAQGAVQHISPSVSVPLSVVDLRGLPVEARAPEALRLGMQEEQRPFDLGVGPLLRVTLLKLGEQEHVLVLVLHHIVSDGWSMGVLTKELEALYTAQVKGGDAALPELPVQYADYAVWQREWLKGEVLEEQLSWWRAKLEGTPEALELPTDRPRPAVQGHRGASLAVRLSFELSEKLKRLSRAEDVTLYMTLLAAFQVLLARYSGQWDVVVGSPVSGRTRKEVEGLIGFFVNTLVVRTEASRALTFRELLAQVRESVLGAFAHQEVPFEKLVDALQLSRDLSRSPLVQVSFALQSAPSGDLSLPGLALRPLDLGTQVAKFDLALSVREDSEGMAGYWVFNTDLFDPETVERLAIHYESLLKFAVAMPDARLDALGMPGHTEVPERAPSARIRAQRTERRDSEPTLESFIAPRTAMEERVAELWAPLLGVKRVGAEDHFFERGGHSLLVMQVASRLRETLGRDVPVRMLFEAPTVSALASRLDELVKDGLRTGRPELVPTARTEALPQSFAQQRLWFLDRLEPGGSLYNIALAMKLEGVLQVKALERAFNDLVRRHESLRTTFHQHEQGAVQRIHAAASLPLSVVDLSGLPVETREQEALRLGAEEGRRPFDLSAGPLLRVTLLKLGEQEHVLVLVLHHIVADGWSTWVLTKELETLYGAHVKGEAATLPELPVQYVDYAVWQREWLKEEVLESQLSWWRTKLAGVPEALEVPTDRPRPAVQGSQGASVAVKLSTVLSEKLKQLSLREGVTLYMTLLAGFQVLLARYSGQWDVVVGSPVSGRTTKEVEGLIGLFVNTLVVRTEASGELTFREMLGRVKESVLGAFGHQEVPFEKLVEALSLRRDMSRAPLVQVGFQLLNTPSGDLSLSGLTQRPLDLGLRAAKVDLALGLREAAEGIEGVLEFSSDLYDVATMERFGEHLERLLEGAVTEPDRRLRDLPLLSESSRRELLARGGSEAPFEGECLHRMFEAQVARTPEAVAVEMEGRTLTYAQLDRRAHKLATVLRKWGVRPDVVVGLCLGPSLDWVVAMLAILKAGGAYLPMDPEHPPERLAYMLDDAKVALLVSRSEEASQLAWSGATVLLDEIGELDDLVGAESLAPEVTARNLAYVIYTSGSTGRPKGTLLAHRGAANLVESFPSVLGGLGPGDRTLMFATVSFDASVAEVFPALLHGATLVLARRAQMAPGRPLAELLARERISVATLPPSVLAMMPVVELPRLRVLLSAGEACTAELVARWSPGRRFINGYGPTEGTVAATWGECFPGTRPTIGRPLRNVVVRVMDDAGNLVPRGVWGELYLGGVGLARGYLGRPDLTAERFVPDPYGDGGRLYRTGDVVRLLEDGRFEYLRRADAQVKVRGVRVEPAEASAALTAHPEVRSAVVMGREDTPGDTRLVAYVVPTEDAAPLTADVLRAWLKRSLPEPWVPSVFVMLRELPLTPNGKVDWKALPVPEAHRPELSGGYVAPQEGLEQVLAQSVAEVLKLDRVGADDNFFDLGGNSLLLQMLQLKLEERLERKVPLVLLLQFSTVRTLAAQLGPAPEPEAPRQSATSGDRREGLQRLAQQRRRRPGSD
ncbi:non-ribosomal peptide synthase/polyketide synthase [Myxococcus qinghaiensis]|uniref:non-ribosomal peptide synthase/polyketide synthase n=1 Tax=Myxococcus qinghaiensis TaxID=2906758 RepID=UPI0020A7F184|nr:non-ribosomal peptide synthase/polyketide synthase [Myxococcus qinghaiensis]MCP3162991.1 non-ribosomal peptide synthase/polyketide synthase [Myxococcus qinghaiensis]